MRISMLAAAAAALTAGAVQAQTTTTASQAGAMTPPAASQSADPMKTPAQPAPSAAAPSPMTPQASAADAAGAPASAVASSQYAAGTQVYDPQGGMVGTVDKVWTQADGSSVVGVVIDGNTLGLPANALRMTDGKLTASVGKAQILAAAPK